MSKNNGSDLQLANFDRSQIADIQATVDLSELMEKIRQIKALKVALDACHRFHENAVRYAQLEAAALIRVVELGGKNRLRGDAKGAAEWIFGLDITQRERFIAMCADGLTISQVWKREIKNPELLESALSELDDIRDELVEKAKKSGHVTLEYYVKYARRKLPHNVAEDVVDGMRNALRKAGAVGIGFGSLEYIMPRSENKAAVKQAVKLRYESIAKDVMKIKEIVDLSGVKLSSFDIDDRNFHSNPEYRNILVFMDLALLNCGVISDADSVYYNLSCSNAVDTIDDAAKYCRRQKGADDGKIQSRR